ncbi:hypothetical protein EDC19_2381 [Natranaerovirga hydrolytica]|uniref:Serine aminopeptidase S33 domain-containing protein n=1 Tax=Natranaerovirga hydrolytica TaxID=680378 RepID=A0A4R1MFT8_9FIRM|nr:alpha/beta fold hydrolase [Natranaerovirga hydrolytica]TCK90612.1 hypothetical protein EDC19_2381 [Natranaerovirga hydrolytica]
MKKYLGILLIIMSVIFVGCDEFSSMPSDTQDVTEVSNEKLETMAKNYVEDLLNGNYVSAYNDYPHSEDLTQAVNENIYETMMGQITVQFGEFVEFVDTQTVIVDSHTSVVINSAFSYSNINIIITFDDDENINGINIAPINDTTPIDSEKYYTTNITFGTQEYPLEGTLTLPKNVDSPPVVILVHGSGPNDRDETIGPNKPFRDIAYALANNGIASFRYDKRTYTYPEATAFDTKLTVYEETIEDAYLAVDTLSTLDEIDPDNIYLIGHSLGGYVIPRIAQKTDGVAGYVVMAGNSRNLLDVVEDQYAFFLGRSDNLSPDELAQLNVLKDSIELIRSDSIDEHTPVLGSYKPYWKDLMAYEPLELVLEIDQPILFLQGERDYQVTMTDFNLWKETVGHQDKNTFVSLEGINHLMMFGEGEPNPEEYFVSNTVADSVIEAIVHFILN